MKLSETQKLANHICRLLKVSEINFPIGKTPKGNFGLVFNANNEGFEMLLDSVPLSTKNSLEDENNIELKRMIEKYLFEQETVYKSPNVGFSTDGLMGLVISEENRNLSQANTDQGVKITPVNNKGGRPKKVVSKNGNNTTKETS